LTVSYHNTDLSGDRMTLPKECQMSIMPGLPAS